MNETKKVYKLNQKKLEQNYATIIAGGWGGDTNHEIVIDLEDSKMYVNHKTHNINDHEIIVGDVYSLWDDEDTLSSSVNELELWVRSEFMVRNMLAEYAENLTIDEDFDYELV